MRVLMLKVFGRRVLVMFGGVSMLSVAILAALYLSSEYALEGYITDQLRLIPWDISVIQRGETHRFPELRRELQDLDGVKLKDVEGLGLLRIRNSAPLRVEIDGAVFPIRWIGFVGASRSDLLPPELRRSASSEGVNAGYELALVGAQREGRGGPGEQAVEASKRIGAGSVMRLALLTQEPSGPVDFDVDEHDEHNAEGQRNPAEIGQTLFQASIALPPVQIERQEFNKWMLRAMGSLAYLPEQALIVAVPPQVFEDLSVRFRVLFQTVSGVGGGEASAQYLPEVTHLMRIDRERLVSPWEVKASLDRIAPLIAAANDKAIRMTPFANVNSDLRTLLQRMSDIGRLVQIVTVLIAVPLFWLNWVLARNLSGLLMLNERRLIGLALVRGIPMGEISLALLLALLLGGLAGSLAGLILGTALPVIGYAIAGHPFPSPAVFFRGLAFFVGFAVIGVSFAVLSGFGILRYVRRMTPREALARVVGNESERLPSRLSAVFVGASLVSLALGSYKMACWVVGHSIALAYLGPDPSELLVRRINLTETILNFVAVPLLLVGLNGLLSWRVGWVQKALSGLTAPFVGSSHWWVGEHMAMRRHRVVTVLCVASMAMALTVLPQVAADTFYGRVLRGVRISVGGDLNLDFNMAELLDGQAKIRPLAEYQQGLAEPMATIRSALSKHAGIASVTTIQQFLVPGVYVPGQSGLPLNVVDTPDEYLNTVYYENALGVTRPFDEIINNLGDPKVTASQGLLRVRKIPMDRDVTLGYSGNNPVPVRFRDVLTYLPGQPSMGVSEREGYAAAEVDYLNYMLSSDARMIAGGAFVKAGLSALSVLPSRSVVVVKTQSGEVDDKFADEIAATLPFRPQEMRWQLSERKRVGKDMYISLALENMKVFMIGGLILSLCSVAAIGLANFLADRRTFGLLRLRGLPLSLLFRISLAMFLTPVLAGLLIGVVLGTIAGFGISQAIWELPRVGGIAGLLKNQVVFSYTAFLSTVVFSLILSAIAVVFGLWPIRSSAREAARDR